MLNTTFNNISVISSLSVLLVDETRYDTNTTAMAPPDLGDYIKSSRVLHYYLLLVI